MGTGTISSCALLAATSCLAFGAISVEAGSDPGDGDVVRYGWDGDDASYDALWSAPYGPGEGTRTLASNSVTVDATTFTTAADQSVFDHLKYIRISSETFATPESGSLEFSVDITADTSGTDPDRAISGCYGESLSFETTSSPCDAPYSHQVLEGQQAGVVLNMVSFATGQLFDWFVSDNQVFALIERLPSNVTGAGEVGLDLAYTQIVKVADVTPGETHNVGIRYTRRPGESYVEYLLDGELFVRVDHVGIPVDKQADAPFAGYAPSLGAGEELADQLDEFSIGHGLFSLLDVFPYQHPERPDLSVSIPLTERLFGQGAVGTWSDFTVTTITD